MSSAPVPPGDAPRRAIVLGLVMLGGAVGVVVRAVLIIPVTDPSLVPWVTAGINVVGSFLLGVVVGWLDDRHLRARAFAGTGVLGGFTTYSAFAVQAAGTATTAFWPAAALVAVSVVAGLAGAVIGLFVGRRIADVPGEIEPPEAAE